MNDFHIGNKVLRANTLLILMRIFIKRIIWVKYLKNCMYVRVYEIFFFYFSTCTIYIFYLNRVQSFNFHKNCNRYKIGGKNLYDFENV